jgi:hypothetical protein
MKVKLLNTKSCKLYYFGIHHCSQTFLVYLFLRFASISYGRFVAIHCKLNLSSYVQELLVIGRRGCTGRDLNEKRLAVDTGH